MQAKWWSRTSSSSKAALTAAVFCLGAAHAGTVDPELAARVARDQGAQRFPVIVRLNRQSDASDLARKVSGLPQAQRGGRLLEQLKAFNTPLQAPLLKDLAARKAEQVQALWTVNAVAAHLSGKDVREIARRDDVASVRYDIGLLAPSRRMVADPCRPERPTPRQRLPKYCTRGAPGAAASAASFDPQLVPSAALQGLAAPAAWQAGFTGKGVTLAVVDTGVDLKHADLAGSFRGGAADWYDVHGEHAAPIDRHGHGTQLAGLAVGTGANGQIVGVAPQARWIGARIYNDRNIGRLSQLHRIMAWLLDPDGNPQTADAPQVVLNAWGLGDRPGQCDEEFASDLRWLRAAGMHVVFAAGNGGPTDNSSVSPANNAGALAVGALDASGQPALFSSRGASACDARPYPDVLAPGELLRTTDLSAGGIPTSTLVTGTSYAAALVSGELLLLVQARPQMSLAERESALRATAGERQKPPLATALGLKTTAATGQQP
jgi:subtilisin family serine protease